MYFYKIKIFCIKFVCFQNNLDLHKLQRIKMRDKYLKGRGAQINPSNKFDKYVYDDQTSHLLEEGENQIRTQYIEVFPKTILNKVDSPDIPFDYSMNPYQGCEHGCVYCYARNTHPFWGYSAGLDFEQKILYKKEAQKLLSKRLASTKWKATPIMLSGNTDCYQPAEKSLMITRAILETFWKYRHPVGLITKNSLLLRDLDILKKLAENNLVRVAISITTMDETLRQFLEPRTSSSISRFKTIKQLSKAGIPVSVMIAPIIPGLNEHEILSIAQKASECGATSIGSTIVRLNGDVGLIFEDWLNKKYPDRAKKILNKIKSCHGGELADSRFGRRMRGEGNIAKIINAQLKLAKRKYFSNCTTLPFNLALHENFKKSQLKLF